jgi:hypothetical protein
LSSLILIHTNFYFLQKGVMYMATNSRNMTGAEMSAQVQSRISQFSPENLPLAERMHTLILEAVPTLQPRLWYGMPGYAKTKDSAVILFFREDKYMTFGLTEAVSLYPQQSSSTQLMPCAWYFTKLDTATEQAIEDIVQKAAANS